MSPRPVKPKPVQSGTAEMICRTGGVRAAIRTLPFCLMVLLFQDNPGAAQSGKPTSGPPDVSGLPALEYLTGPAIDDQAASSLPLRPVPEFEVEPLSEPESQRELQRGPNRDRDPARNDTGRGAGGTLGAAMQEMARRNPVVAVVEGEQIRWTDVLDSASDLPPEYRERIESVFPALLDRLIDLKLLAGAGRAEGFDDDENLVRRVRAYEDLLIRDAYVAERIAARITEAEVRERYFEVLRAGAAQTERHLRHVVVDSRAEALEVVRALDGGVDFAELARLRSTGSSAAGGGDLGFLRRNDLEPAFAAAAFDLMVGAYGRTPLRTRFGWHVIRVEGERKAVLPTYEEMAPKLREELARQRTRAALGKLRAEADLELFPEE